jgi:flagellar motor switch protein FliN/FliY
MAGEQVAEARIDELEDDSGLDRAHLALDDLAGVPVRVAAELGRAKTRVREVLDLKVGSIVTLEKVAGETTDITLNGISFARGEVVVIGDMLHVRIAEIGTGPERVSKHNG